MTGSQALEEIVDRGLIYLTDTGGIEYESRVQREYFWIDLDLLLSIVEDNLYPESGEDRIDWTSVTREYLEMTA